MLVLVLIKAALFPLFGWAACQFNTWPGARCQLCSPGLLTKVGVYALIRLVTLLWPEPGVVHSVLFGGFVHHDHWRVWVRLPTEVRAYCPFISSARWVNDPGSGACYALGPCWSVFN